MAEDEDVIRRRLLIDGDGTGDDRRLNVLLKTFIKWSNSTDEKPEESKSTHDRMLAQLAQCEFAANKSQLASEMTAAELQSYEALSHILKTGIEAAKGNIEMSKADLAQAKTVRKNHMECEVLAKLINEEPDRKDNAERLETLRKELSNLEATKQQLESRLSSRKKQCHVLVTSVHQLQALLDDPNECEFQADESDSEEDLSQAHVDESQTQAKESQAQVDENLTQVDESKSLVDERKSQPDESGSQIVISESLVDERETQMDESQTQAKETQAQADKSQTQVDKSKSLVDKCKSQAEESESQIVECISMADETKPLAEDCESQTDKTQEDKTDQSADVEMKELTVSAENEVP